MLSALNFLHSIGIAHCDFKAENILFDSHADLKLIDFDDA